MACGTVHADATPRPDSHHRQREGRKNWAYKLARRAEAGEPGMHYARITAKDAVAAGVLDQEEIDDARATLTRHRVFRKLYEARAE